MWLIFNLEKVMYILFLEQAYKKLKRGDAVLSVVKFNKSMIKWIKNLELRFFTGMDTNIHIPSYVHEPN
jgi:hypothetical protein